MLKGQCGDLLARPSVGSHDHHPDHALAADDDRLLRTIVKCFDQVQSCAADSGFETWEPGEALLGETCTADELCTADYICAAESEYAEEGTCMAICEVDLSCPQTYTCDQTFGICLPD